MVVARMLCSAPPRSRAARFDGGGDMGPNTMPGAANEATAQFLTRLPQRRARRRRAPSVRSSRPIRHGNTASRRPDFRDAWPAAPEAIDFLRGSDLIVHGGDICDTGEIDTLGGDRAPVAVRGNNDHGAWADATAPKASCSSRRRRALRDPRRRRHRHEAAAAASRSSLRHSHKPSGAERGGVLYVNPGSAGPRRFKLPISVGELTSTRP